MIGGLGMGHFIIQSIRTRWQSIPKKQELHNFKRLVLLGLAVGLFLFFLLGKEYVESTALLNIEALKVIRDNAIEKKEFFLYLLPRRLMLLAIGMMLWWWGFGRLYLYALLGIGSMVMGACLYISLIRYPFTGLFLWFFLYFPHILFYAGSIFCGMMLTYHGLGSKEEKLKYLWQNSFLVFLLLVLYLFGIYNESYVNVALLQNFLQYF